MVSRTKRKLLNSAGLIDLKKKKNSLQNRPWEKKIVQNQERKSRCVKTRRKVALKLSSKKLMMRPYQCFTLVYNCIRGFWENGKN